MRRVRHYALERVRVMLVVALTLLPIALSGHFHTATAGSTCDACSVCVVKHHTGAANPLLRPIAAPVVTTSAVVVFTTAVPAFVPVPCRIGRAPPAPLAVRVA